MDVEEVANRQTDYFLQLCPFMSGFIKNAMTPFTIS